MLSIITITGENITSITGYIGELWGDLWPFVVVIFGIGLAFWIFGAIIEALRPRKNGEPDHLEE